MKRYRTTTSPYGYKKMLSPIRDTEHDTIWEWMVDIGFCGVHSQHGIYLEFDLPDDSRLIFVLSPEVMFSGECCLILAPESLTFDGLIESVSKVYFGPEYVDRSNKLLYSTIRSLLGLLVELRAIYREEVYQKGIDAKKELHPEPAGS
jgi:hypothetical protein